MSARAWVRTAAVGGVLALATAIGASPASASDGAGDDCEKQGTCPGEVGVWWWALWIYPFELGKDLSVEGHTTSTYANGTFRLEATNGSTLTCFETATLVRCSVDFP
ncbi:hypothetical protein [Cellulomonas cellasea]|uniref:Ig-like domain-containing protein n=1 Tax=Cellulomonas cellasea TaxID=43670 RepID=A0A7W4YCZ9_9CELL|nr:hypothetical protein [Cellulomonas cellasea]MBB2925540.1 hypothetical protein [Cellulomonas cellasea]